MIGHARMRTALSIASLTLVIGPIGESQPLAQSQTPGPPLSLAQPDRPSGPPAVLTLRDALARARQNDQQFQTAVAEADLAREDRVQAKSSLLPAVSYTTQYLGNSPNGVNPNGRFVSLDGVKMYRSWLVLHQELSPNVVMGTPLRRAQAAEAAAQARLEVARRGLDVTVTRAYYALVSAQRRYATAQLSAQQASRFLDITRRQFSLGQVARSDSVKAEIQYRQQEQAYREAFLSMDNARLLLAVLASSTLDENFTVVDDLAAVPALPPFTDVHSMAERNNPDIEAATEALRAAGQDIRAARNAFMPSVMVDAVYGIEANEFALHSRVAAQPELGVLPNLGYFITVNLNVPVWDWGGLRSKLHQSETKARQAQVTLSQTQRQVLGNLYSMYNEAVTAKSALESLQQVAELAAESLRLVELRYEAGESTALEVVDAQNTFVQARNAADEAGTRYRVALAELQTVSGPF